MEKRRKKIVSKGKENRLNPDTEAKMMTVAKEASKRLKFMGIPDDIFVPIASAFVSEIGKQYGVPPSISKFVTQKGLGLLDKGAKMLGNRYVPKLLGTDKKAIDSEIKSVSKDEMKKEIAISNAIMGPSRQPLKTRAPTMTRTADHSVCEGEELINVLSVGTSSATTGSQLASVDINPTVINLPMLKSFVRNFEMYEVVECSFTLIGASGNNVAGNFIMCYDPDPCDVWLAEEGTLEKKASIAKVKVSGRPFDEVTLRIPCTKGRLYLGVDETQQRFQSFGSFHMVVLSPIAASTQIGSLYMKYKIRLYATQIDSVGYTGDFWGASSQDTSSPMSTSQALATSSWITPLPNPTMPMPVLSDTEKKNGDIPMPPGSYHLDLAWLGGTGMTFTGPRVYSLQQVGSTAPWEYASGYMASTSATLCVATCWVGCSSQFIVRLCPTAGTWTKVTIAVTARSTSPYAITLSGLRRLEDMAKQADCDSAKIDLLRKSTFPKNKGKEDNSKDDFLLVDNNYMIPSSSSSLSTNNSSSTASYNRVMIKRT